MSIIKLYTIPELQQLGLPIIAGTQSYKNLHLKEGDIYISDSVVSMWDMSDYSDWFTYFDNNIQHKVSVNKIMPDDYIKSTALKKDMSYDFGLKGDSNERTL